MSFVLPSPVAAETLSTSPRLSSPTHLRSFSLTSSTCCALPFQLYRLLSAPAFHLLGAILAALPHWAAIVAAHSAPGARVRCDAVPFSLTFNCSGVHQGNHFLAPVLGNGDLRHPLHNLHQLRGMARGELRVGVEH